MSVPSRQAPENIFLCSSVMRAPYIFEQYNTVVKKGDAAEPAIENLVRDLVIYLAWNKAEEVRLNVREFGNLFGYSHAYLLRRVTPHQEAWLKQKDFNPTDFKDLITFALAKLYIEVANFAKSAPYSVPTVDVRTQQVNGREDSYEGICFIGKCVVNRSQRGTTYTFRQHPAHIINCRDHYQEFILEEYLSLCSGGRAWVSARRMFLHLAWKRGVWNEAIRRGKADGHEKAQLDELLRVAGLRYKDEKRQIHELRELLKPLAKLETIRMSAEIAQNSMGIYEVCFTRLEPEKPAKNTRKREPAT